MESEIAVEGGREHDGEEGGGRGAADEEDHDGDQDQDQHSLLGTLQGLPPRRPRDLSLKNRPSLQKRGG